MTPKTQGRRLVLRLVLIPLVTIICVVGAIGLGLTLFGDAGGRAPAELAATSKDGDGDGIPDQTETSGWRTERGDLYITRPDNPDTDGDGLSDGEEAGPSTGNPNRGGAYAGSSDPTESDSDADGLDDATERDGGFSAWEKDSDGDDLDDLAEIEFGSDPLITNADGDHLDDAEEQRNGSDPNTYDLTRAHASAAFLGGGVAGDCESAARKARLDEDQRDSWQYLAGSMASGLAAVGDARDLACNIGSREWATARNSLVGVVPVLGDGAKVTASAIKFAKRGGRATPAAMHFIATTPALKARDKERVVRKIVRLDPAKARLGADASVRGTPVPPSLPTVRRISLSASQNGRKDEEVRKLQTKGYTDIRVNQRQVDSKGKLVGINRPDIQATAPNGKRHYYELDTSSSTRGPSHMTRLLSNDDDGDVHLIKQD